MTLKKNQQKLRKKLNQGGKTASKVELESYAEVEENSGRRNKLIVVKLAMQRKQPIPCNLVKRAMMLLTTL